MAWICVIMCMLTATVVSSVLAARLWALYGQDRRVLAALIMGFLAWFVPGWTLTFSRGPSSLEPDQLRIIGNVFMYISGVTVQEGYDALDWRLKKCYHLPFSKISSSIFIGSLHLFGLSKWHICRADLENVQRPKADSSHGSLLSRVSIPVLGFRLKEYVEPVGFELVSGVIYYVVIFCELAGLASDSG